MSIVIDLVVEKIRVLKLLYYFVECLMYIVNGFESNRFLSNYIVLVILLCYCFKFRICQYPY